MKSKINMWLNLGKLNNSNLFVFAEDVQQK